MNKLIGLVILTAALVSLNGCGCYRLTIPQIVELSGGGVPDQEICEKIEDSCMVYRLKGSQLAELSGQGISDNVVDCIQQTYIRAVRNDQMMEDWSNWEMAPDGFWYW